MNRVCSHEMLQTELSFVLQVWKAGHHPQECSEAEAGVGEVAGWSRALEPERPAKSDGVCWRWAIQKTQATYQFHTTGNRSSQLLLREERVANRPRDYRNCERAELRPRGCASMVLQPATDVEKHEQNQRLPGAVATACWEASPPIFCRFGKLNI